VNVVFLDIDGVLNNSKTRKLTSYTRSPFVDPAMLKRLRKILDATKAEVVLSSDWRYDRDDERYNQDFIELKYLLGDYGIEFYDFTPERLDGNRGLEIKEFLDNHKEVTNYVVLDDRSDACVEPDKFIHTSMSVGLTDDHVQEAIDILSK